MSEKISVIVKKPGRVPYRTYMANTLENFQKAVDGYIECFGIAGDAVIICNEEGLLRRMPYNCTVNRNPFVGTIIFAGVDKRGDFVDYPVDFQTFKRTHANLWEV